MDVVQLLSPREKQILEVLEKGIHSPTMVASELGVTQSGATQALQKLQKKGVVVRTQVGRNAFYRPVEEKKPEKSRELEEEDLALIRESYHALSRVWSHVLRLDLSHEELNKVREARNLLEEILVRRGTSLD